MTQQSFFDPPAPHPKPHGRTKCRRAGCGHPSLDHAGRIGQCGNCACSCDGFLAEPEAHRIRLPAPSNAAYREAYERGIRRASSQPFVLVGARVGSLLGPVLRVFAIDANGAPLTGEALLAWLEADAYAFRKATDGKGHYHGHWSIFGYCNWKNDPAQPAAKVAPVLRKQPGGKRRQ